MPLENQQDAAVAQDGPKLRKRLMMPAVVLGLLGGHMTFIFTAITLGTGDPSFAVVPDYYQKAVSYDDRKAQLAASEAMGWGVVLETAPTVSTSGQRELILRLTDRDGNAVTGAELRVSCYHLSNAREPESFELKEVLPGQYLGEVRMTRKGFWWFGVEATQGEALFVNEFKQYISAAEEAR